MSRLILIVAIVALVYWLLSSYRRQTPKQDESPNSQDMVSCAYCGIHLPKSESIVANEKYYCCTAHSRGQPEA